MVNAIIWLDGYYLRVIMTFISMKNFLYFSYLHKKKDLCESHCSFSLYGQL